jgi:DNA-directed RNA polymerase specialized sigma24 family protein
MFDGLFVMNKMNPIITSLSLVDLINNAKVSARLRNSINQAVQRQSLSFITVGDFLAAEDGVKKLMQDVPSLGKKTASEFVQLIDNILKSQDGNINPFGLSSTHHQDQLNKSNKFLTLFNEGFSYKDIAELNDVSEVTVRKYLNENSDFDPKLKRALDKSNKFFELSKEGFSYQDIAELYGLSEGTVRKYLHEHPDFDKRSAPAALQRQQKRLEKSNEFLELYKQGLTYQDIGDKYGLTRERVRQLLNFNPAFHEYLEAYEVEKAVAEQEKEEQKKRKLDEGNLAFLYPDRVAALWDHEKNGELKPDDIQAGKRNLPV